MKFELPKLPYAYDALEPWIDARTMEIHHAKHHRAYVDKLNAALTKYPDTQETSDKRQATGTGWGESEIEILERLLGNLNSVPEDIRAAVRNHGGGHYNHSLFWKMMGPHNNGKWKMENGKLLDAINTSFGGFEKFQEQFSASAAGVFGSGWAWLIVNPKSKNQNPKLEITTTPNQDTPLALGYQPILGLDVWEHAYYLKYQNRRPEYIEAWFNLVNWREVERLYSEEYK